MEQPNIIFITTDTQGRDMLSCYTDRPCVETPNLDQFASESVRFANVFATCPLCTPARSSWYTGLFPNRSGAFANGQSPHRNIPMLGDLLSNAGYHAVHLGKWHLDAIGYYDTGKPDGGFDPQSWYDIGAFIDEVGRDGLNRFGGWNKGLEDIQYCLAHRIADRAIDILKAPQEKPLFLAVEFDEPHGPYICPSPYRGRFAYEDIYRPPTLGADLSNKPTLQQKYSKFLAAGRPNPNDLPKYYTKYYDCNTYVDHEIGRVIDAINTHCKDAIIIFTSDHGDHVGAFGLSAKGPTMYDHTTAVPLIIHAPTLASAPSVETRLVSSVDIWTTILDLAGIDLSPFTINKGYTGRSLTPALKNEAHTSRDHIFVEYNRFGISQSQCEGLYPIRCVRTLEWKLNINLFDRDELYHISEDPHERDNRIDDSSLQNIRNALHDQILNWQEKTKDPFRSPQWGQRPWRPDFNHTFEGLFTTGYKDNWQHERFS